jgi:hypothetical protein
LTIEKRKVDFPVSVDIIAPIAQAAYRGAPGAIPLAKTETGSRVPVRITRRSRVFRSAIHTPLAIPIAID